MRKIGIRTRGLEAEQFIHTSVLLVFECGVTSRKNVVLCSVHRANPTLGDVENDRYMRMHIEEIISNTYFHFSHLYLETCIRISPVFMANVLFKGLS